MRTEKTSSAKFLRRIFSSSFGAVFILFAFGCGGYNYSGEFAGDAKYTIKKYNPFWQKELTVENMTFALEREDSTYYILKLGENSPVQCSLKVENVYYDHEGKGEETSVMNLRGSPDQTCKVTDADGNEKKARVVERITGEIAVGKEVNRNSVRIVLRDSQDYIYELVLQDGKRTR